jgi:HipA-like C-terminal domain
MVFPVIAVDEKQIVGDEQLGSKRKFWYESAGERWLFKEAREIVAGEFAGEDWAEKLAAEIASLLEIPAARVELAEYRGQRGSASKRFLNSANQSLVHGNEILSGMIAGYDRDKKLHQHDHTLENILAAFERFLSGNELLRVTMLQQLAEYFVLDALIGNTDRHHENWASSCRLTLRPAPVLT